MYVFVGSFFVKDNYENDDIIVNDQNIVVFLIWVKEDIFIIFP